MSLNEWAKLGEASATVSATVAICAALFGAWWSLRDARARERDNDLLGWQKATIWEIIARDGPLGFNKIRDSFATATFRSGEMDKRHIKALQTERLQVILLSLIESRAIHVVPVRHINDQELKYSILRFDPAGTESNLDDMWLVLGEIEDHNGTLDEPALKNRLEKSGRFSDGQLAQVGKILIRLEASNLIYRDQDGKIIRRQVTSVVVPTGASETIRPRGGGPATMFNRPSPKDDSTA